MDIMILGTGLGIVSGIVLFCVFVFLSMVLNKSSLSPIDSIDPEVLGAKERFFASFAFFLMILCYIGVAWIIYNKFSGALPFGG